MLAFIVEFAEMPNIKNAQARAISTVDFDGDSVAIADGEDCLHQKVQ